jgi:hypothetical protein
MVNIIILNSKINYNFKFNFDFEPLYQPTKGNLTMLILYQLYSWNMKCM